jgi:hypothetical protein
MQCGVLACRLRGDRQRLHPAARLQRESRTTPIIFIQAGNPVGSGLVANLARPGGKPHGVHRLSASTCRCNSSSLPTR